MAARPRVSILITCYNRRDTTLACLGALEKAAADSVDLKLFIVDDNSTDGTSEAIAELYSEAKLIKGTGNLYWNRGMRRAWSEALSTPTDYYLWLNDDLALLPGSLRALVEYGKRTEKLIVVGRTLDPSTGKTTYGGYIRREGLSRLRFRRANEDEIVCDTMNGNCVLFPSSVVEDVGINNPHLSHSLGDMDYGLRAVRAGYTLMQMPEPVGYQVFNHKFMDSLTRLTFSNAKFLLTHPKGVPATEWFAYCRSNGGPLWPINFGLRYVKMLFGKGQ